MVRTERVLCCLNARVLGERRPLVVIEVCEYQLNSLGLSRVIAIDPTNSWRRLEHASGLRDCVKNNLAKRFDDALLLLGKEYPTFQQAGQDVHLAIYGTRANVFRDFQCLLSVHPDEKGAAPLLLRVPGVVERIPSKGEMIDTRFVPETATTHVVMHVPHAWPIAEGMFWRPIGEMRPLASSRTEVAGLVHLTDEEMARELKVMLAKVRDRVARAASEPLGGCLPLTRALTPTLPHWRVQGFASRKHARDRKQPLEDGELAEEGPAKKAKQGRNNVAIGKAIFLHESNVDPSDGVGRLPFVIVSNGLRNQVDSRGSKSASNHATLRSLADDSQRVVRSTWVVGLCKYFEERYKNHLCEALPHCMTCRSLIAAAKCHAERQTPPVPLAVEWRRLCPSHVTPPAFGVRLDAKHLAACEPAFTTPSGQQ